MKRRAYTLVVLVLTLGLGVTALPAAAAKPVMVENPFSASFPLSCSSSDDVLLYEESGVERQKVWFTDFPSPSGISHSITQVQSEGSFTNLSTGESVTFTSRYQYGGGGSAFREETIEIGDKFRFTIRGLAFKIFKPDGGVAVVSAGSRHFQAVVVDFFETGGGELIPIFETVRDFDTPQFIDEENFRAIINSLLC